MLAASVIRSLNRIHGRNPSFETKKKSGKRKHSDTQLTTKQSCLFIDVVRDKLKYAKSRHKSLETLLNAGDEESHPLAILRRKANIQQLHEWKKLVTRFEREVVRHVNKRNTKRTNMGGQGEMDAKNSYIEKHVVHSDQCLHCGARDIRINAQKNTRQCTKCFREEACFDVVHAVGERPMTSKQNHYYPKNHWSATLNNAQGMRCGTPPPEIIEKVNDQLLNIYHIDIESIKLVEHETICKILKDLGYKKISKHGVLIWCIITGRTAERLTIEEDREADKYCQAYLRVIRDVIHAINVSHRLDRKNLLSYDYLAYKIFELLSFKNKRYRRHMKWYKLLKGNDKLWLQDRLWHSVCARYGWDYHPTS